MKTLESSLSEKACPLFSLDDNFVDFVNPVSELDMQAKVLQITGMHGRHLAYNTKSPPSEMQISLFSKYLKTKGLKPTEARLQSDADDVVTYGIHLNHRKTADYRMALFGRFVMRVTIEDLTKGKSILSNYAKELGLRL